MASLDRQKFASVCALLNSPQEGERNAALNRASHLLAAAKISWRDVVESDRRAAEAEEVAKLAIAELQQVQSRLAELEQSAGDGWGQVAVPASQAAKIADWALGIWREGACWMSDFERGFLVNLSRWCGPATTRQQDRLQQIVDRIYTRTRRRPPP